MSIRRSTYSQGVIRLGSADLTAAFEFVGTVGEADSPASFHDAIITEAAKLIRCDLWVSLSELAWDQSKVLLYHAGPLAPSVDESEFWSSLSSNPLFRHRVETRESRALKMSDFLTQRRFRQTRLYHERFRPHGVEYQLEVQLPPTVETETVLVLNRGQGPDFSERDRALLDLVQPHLARLYQLAKFRGRAAGDATAVRRLTKRELEVLALAAEGRTNHEIATALTVAEGTVRKHLDNVYEKLEVHNRTAAVARVGLVRLAHARNASDPVESPE